MRVAEEELKKAFRLVAFLAVLGCLSNGPRAAPLEADDDTSPQRWRIRVILPFPHPFRFEKSGS